MFDSILFSVVNVTVGFIVSWILAHYILPLLFGAQRNLRRSMTISAIYTVAAFVRNIVIYGAWVS